MYNKSNELYTLFLILNKILELMYQSQEYTLFFLFTALPLKCGNLQCYCYYYLDARANIYNCSSSQLKVVPSVVPNLTNWVVLKNNNIANLNEFQSYFSEIQFLNLKGNLIASVGKTFLSELQKDKSNTWINLANNKLKMISPDIQNLTHLQKVWLGGNPFHCDCSMTWMISWLNNFKTQSGEHIIQDYQKLICHSGKAKGLPIFTLNRVILGCYPKELTTWQKIIIGVGSGIGLILIAFLLAKFVQRSRTFQFFLFHKLKIHSVLNIHNDNEEAIEDKKYDAYLSYR